MTFTTYRRVATLALIALVGACKSDSSVAPSNPPPASLDQVFTEMMQPAVSRFAVAATPSTASMNLMPPAPQGCTYDASAHGFVCPTFSATGLQFTQSYKLYDKSHNPQSGYDAASTDAVEIITTIAGTVTSTAMSSTVSSTEDFTLSGLQSGLHVLNGTTNLHATGTYGPGSPTATPFDETMVVTFSNIVLPAGNEKWPRSGTITVDASSAFPGVSTNVLHMVLTFNGTSKVSITVDGRPFGCVDLSGAVSCTP